MEIQSRALFGKISVRPKPKFRPKFRSTCRNTEIAKNVILTNFWHLLANFQNFSPKKIYFFDENQIHKRNKIASIRSNSF